MFKLDNDFLTSLGLGGLPVDEKNKLLQMIYERLEMNVGMRLAEKMTDQQLDEFESFIDQNDEAGALKWLETNFPNYKDVVAEELEKLKVEVTQAAPQILAAQNSGAPQQPVMTDPIMPGVPQPQSVPIAPQPAYQPQATTPVQQQPIYSQPTQPQPDFNPAPQPAPMQVQQPVLQPYDPNLSSTPTAPQGDSYGAPLVPSAQPSPAIDPFQQPRPMPSTPIAQPAPVTQPQPAFNPAPQPAPGFQPPAQDQPQHFTPPPAGFMPS